ncbi:MAG: hypothetical protein E7337_11990 [Clostridiales bacterium]|nr:hypothetical protein [Clostridiales bacterium]
MTSANFEILSEILREHGINPDGLSSEDAVIKLKEAVGEERVNEDFELQSGDYGLMATHFEIVTAEHFKLVKDFMFKCKVKSLLIGFACQARIKPNIKYRKKPSVAIAEPSQILWEFSGVTYESALTICQKVSEMIGQELRIVYKNIYF